MEDQQAWDWQILNESIRNGLGGRRDFTADDSTFIARQALWHRTQAHPELDDRTQRAWLALSAATPARLC